MTNKEKIVEGLINRKLNITIFEHEMGKMKVHVVKPGEMAVSVYYTDERRYFPTLDENYIVTGGYFG